MINKELIERINELANKKKTEGLTADELNEQQELYKTYLQSVRKQVTIQLEEAGINKKDHDHVCHDGCCGQHHHDHEHIHGCDHHKH